MDTDAPVDQVTVWVEGGWLMAERRTAAGGLEWRIVLAEVAEDDPPTIESNDEHGIFRLSFRDGRYFIRDEQGSLRCLRQRKTQNDWPHVVVPDADPKHEDIGTRGPSAGAKVPAGPAIPAIDELPYLFERTIDAWYFVAVGPSPDAIDCLVRLSHRQLDAERGEHRQVEATSLARLVQARHGSSYHLTDDGELLVARRVEQWQAAQELKRLSRQKKLVGEPPRPFGEGEWLNSDRPVTWDDYRGRVVLLSVHRARTGEGAPPISIDPRLDHWRTKYAPFGLAVIGIVHSLRTAEQTTAIADALQDDAIHWPFQLEADEAMSTDYAFDGREPRYVLVGRDGRVASIGSGRLPTEIEIKNLLNAQ
ncbi:MAG TPA: hypothetical protein VHC22_21400 [Pirellulales bacterium]|nr:hypothetical protein [Pirellulales bacterium]